MSVCMCERHGSSKNVLREHVYSLNNRGIHMFSLSLSPSFFVSLCALFYCQNDFQCMIRAECMCNIKRAYRRDIEFNSF